MPVPSPDTSASLLEQARDRSAGAWERLVALYTPLLTAWFAAAGLQPADGEDQTQRVLEILVRRLPDFEHSGRPGAFRAWLRGIAVNLLHEFRRARGRGAGADLAEVSDPDAALSRLWDEQHDRHVLNSLMDLVRPQFSGPTWQAFRRLALDGAAARVVAAELGLSVNAVLIARSRVLTRLRQEARGLVD
jgi:RNA polymerase sigma-70 factor (ECF subfamily)